VLTQLKISGFKAVKDSGNISLGKLTLFIGRNGSGKSSIIEAMQWLQEATVDGLLAATDERFGSFDELRNRRSTEIGLSLTLAGGPLEVRYELWVGQEKGQAPSVHAERCREGRTSGTRTTIVSRNVPSSGHVRYIAGGNPIRDSDQLALNQVKGTKARGAQRLLRYLRGAVFLRLSPTAMAKRERLRRAKGPMLDEEGRQLAALLSEMTQKERKWVTEQVATIIRDVEGVDVVDEGGLGYFATKERMLARGGTRVFQIPSWLLSEGTRRLTAIFALLATTPRPSLIAIEEIENGLDPWTLQFVFQALRHASDDGVQIILTTHSPFLLDHVYPDEIIHVTRQTGETSYTPIEGYQEVVNYKDVVAPGAMYISGYFKRKKKHG
jgi:predicted ATPase